MNCHQRSIYLVSLLYEYSLSQIEYNSIALYCSISYLFLFTVLLYYIPKTEAECKKKIREEFRRHAHVTDVRIIDKLIIRVRIQSFFPDEGKTFLQTSMRITNYLL